MPALLRLPVELLTEIAKLAPQPIVLTAVCRLLNGVATPIAYRALTLPLSHHEEDPEPGTVARTLGRLLRTMIAQPSIGIHVRHLDISFADVCKFEERIIPEDIRMPAMEAASSHGLCESVRRALATGWLGAALFLLLCYFPNLDSLDLIPLLDWGFYYYITAFRVLPCGLRSLRSVYVHELDVWNDIDHKHIFSLFCLPSLQKIRCDINESLEFEPSPREYQMVLFDGTSQIKDIDIEGNHTETWVLAAMVRSVRSLGSFRYRDGVGAYRPCPGAILGDALQAHSHTLENLEISVIEINYESPTSIGSLHKYTKLTRVPVSMPLLLDNPDPQLNMEMPPPRQIGELLPESLISFDVHIDRDWRHTACGHLTRFIEVELKYVPNLKQLSLGVRGEFRASDLDTVMLQAACISSGIAFSVVDLRH